MGDPVTQSLPTLLPSFRELFSSGDYRRASLFLRLGEVILCCWLSSSLKFEHCKYSTVRRNNGVKASNGD